MATWKNKKLTGIVLPLGALYTKENPVIGEFPDLVQLGKFCKEAGFEIIQLLPVNDTGTQSSPYSGLSAFALHPIYIRIKDIPEFSEVYKSDEIFARAYDTFVSKNAYKLRYDYDDILEAKINILKQLYFKTQLGQSGKLSEEMTKWIKANPWAKTYAVYKNLKRNYMQASWKSWHQNDQKKSPEEIESLWKTKAFQKEHYFYIWCQVIANQQFEEAVKKVKEMGLLIKGDMPILMNEDSCDAWAYPNFFNQDLRAGSPADGDNPNGQNWGFPTYNWKALKADNYSWWKNRLKVAAKYYDAYRLDHILGFFRIWAIPSADCNALNGHTEPYASFKREDLYELGFDDDRIRWLSQPHIPTNIVEDITWNHEVSHQILELLCQQIGNEELWLFNKNLKGSQEIWDCDFKNLCNQDAAHRIKEKLVEYWSNRTLIEISKNKFIPLWTYGKSTSWASLNEAEKSKLEELFSQLNKKNEKLWKKQADEIFTAITEGLKMIPCGEDLGVSIDCVPQTMLEHKILGLRVVRWCRKWSQEGQPYLPFEDYTPLSITTTSVHDSSTIRQWFDEEIKNRKLEKNQTEKEEKCNVGDLIDLEENQEFSPEIAESILKECGKSASLWYINPLQDYLYMNKKYWLESAQEERINVPGTVNKFNWTYRLPVSLEELLDDKDLINKIQNICNGRS
ncbi:MAG: 4-alpha-glucanotransferase [Treponema sp.]|nr:4-alpha-glucanotransferase [Treponema sp.]